VAANGSNVVVTVIVAHILSSRGYGSMAELVALFLVLNMPGSALLVAVVRHVMARRAVGDETHDLWVQRARRGGLATLAVWSVVAVASRGWIGHLLRLPHPDGVAEVLIAGGGWALLSMERGLLQARRAYGRLARNLCVEAGVRAGFTVGLIGAGVGVEGAAFALAAAMAASVVDARLSLRQPVSQRVRATEAVSAATPAPASVVLPMPGGTVQETSDPELFIVTPRPRLTVDLITALAALGLLALLQNVDVLIVGHLAPANAGAYGAISVTTTSVVFGALVLCGYLLPEAALGAHQGNRALRQLAVALALVALPVAALTAVGVADPGLLLRLAFGPDKTAAAPALAMLALANGCLAATVLLTHYLLGMGRRRVIAALAVGAGVLILAVYAAHGRPVGTARAELVAQAALAVVLAGLVARVPRRDGATRDREARR
jgi:O-antigen/teichoic acid export membrane protein